MRWFHAARARARLLLRRPAEERMDAEMAFHIEMETERLRARGLDAVEARRRALVAFGGVDRYREELRDGRGLAWLGGLSLDLRLGARMLGKSPWLTLVGGFGMAVAVALGAGTYALFNSYFFPEIPLHEGDRVVVVGKFNPPYKDQKLLHDFLAWRRELRLLVDLGAFRTVQRNVAERSGLGEPIELAEMTASGFRVARVPALLGRTLAAEDERPGAPAVMVIGHDAWRSRFEGDRAIIGRELRIGRDVHTIVGVMPPGFRFPVNHQYWVPLRVDPRAAVAPGTGPGLDVFARLAPGATRESAQAELTVVARRLAAEGPRELARYEARIVPYVDLFTNAEAGNESTQYAITKFLVGLLLVVVATNVAVLVYARTVTRSSEIAVRTALGASRGRIVAQLFVEALVLSSASALVGLGITAVGLDMLDQALNEDGGAPFWIDPGLSTGTVVYALALALLAAVIVGVLPALRATGSQLRATMGSLGSDARARLGKTWTGLIVAQIAIAVAILPPALLVGGQLGLMGARTPGFQTTQYLTTRFFLQSDMPASADAQADSAAADSRRAVVTALLTRLRQEPAVVAATVSGGGPWEAGGSLTEVDGADRVAERTLVLPVDTAFFGTYGVRLLAGRAFTPTDAALGDDSRPVIVNRSFATELLGGGNPVGRRVRGRSEGDEVNPWHTVVGVVEDFPSSAVNPTNPGVKGMMYTLVLAGEWPGSLITMKLRGTTQEAFVPTLRALAASVDQNLQLSEVQSLDAVYRDDMREGMQAALAIALITGSVLLLSAAGIHSLMAFTVNQRRREFGIRAALGGQPRRILASVLARASRQLAVGLGVGLAASVAMDVATGGSLMSGTALLLVPATAAFMLVVGLLAAAGPARRGLRVQPSEALRAE
jgi:putative ABC transport system permease protein